MTVRTLNKLIADGEKVTLNGVRVLQAQSNHGVIWFLTRRGEVKLKTEDAWVEIEGKQVPITPTYRRRKVEE